MNDKVKKKTQSAPKDEPTEHPPQDTGAHGHLPPPRNFPFTFCYVVGAIVVSIGTGIGFTSAHYIIAILICVLGVAIAVVGSILHKRAERDGEQVPFNWRRILNPILKGLLFIGVWLGFLFLIAKGIDFFWNLGVNHGIERAKNATPTPYATPTPDDRIPVPTNATKELPDGRIMFTDVTPEYLKEIFRNHTTIEANRLIETYKGKWVSFSGNVENVMDISEVKRAVVTIDRGKYRSEAAYFTNPKQIERVFPMQKGNPISVLCRIVSDNHRLSVLFWDCELLES